MVIHNHIARDVIAGLDYLGTDVFAFRDDAVDAPSAGLHGTSDRMVLDMVSLGKLFGHVRTNVSLSLISLKGVCMPTGIGSRVTLKKAREEKHT